MNDDPASRADEETDAHEVPPSVPPTPEEPPVAGDWRPPDAPTQPQWRPPDAAPQPVPPASPGSPAQGWQPPQPPGWQPPPASPGWQPPQPPGWQPPPGHGQGGPPPAAWGSSPGYWGPRYGSSTLAIVAGIVLLVLGILIALLFGITLAFFDLVIAAEPPIGLEREMIGPLRVILGLVVAVGVVQVIAAVGVLAHRGWARAIGLVVSIVGALLSVLVLAGGDAASIGMGLTGVACYSTALFGLIAGGAHFARRY